MTEHQAEMDGVQASAASVSTIISQLERDLQRYSELVKTQSVAARKVEDVGTDLAFRREEHAALQKKTQAQAAALAAARKNIV